MREILSNSEGLISVAEIYSRKSLLLKHKPAYCGNDSGDFATHENGRLFLISNKEYPPNNSKRSKSVKQHRKYITYAETIKHDGFDYELLQGASGIFTTIMHKMIEQLEICQLKWGRVLVVRYDLHQNHYTPTNKLLTRLRNNLSMRLRRNYSISEFGYVWAREKETAKVQHYHCAVFLDGNKIRHSSKVIRMIREVWKNINENNHVPVVPNPYYFVDDEETKMEAIKRISYLAKSRGKGYRDAQANDYSTSRLIAPKREDKL